MKNVSFKRMMLFSRLLLNNACAYSFLKGAGVMAAVILFCIIKPILTEGNDMQAMMTTSEDLLKVLFIVPLPLFQAAAIGISKPVPGLMIPASLIEKYISVYFCAFIAAVIGMAGGVALLHELPSGAGIAGLGLILLGSYWILGAGSGGFHWRILLREDILYRFGALVLTALEAVFIKRVILLSSVEISFLGWCWFGALFSLAGAAVFRGRRSGKTPGAFSVLRRNWFPLAALALCFGAMQFATNLVFDELPVGPALALFQLSAAVNLWFGWRFFRERDMKKKILGTIVTMIGAGLIILFC